MFIFQFLFKIKKFAEKSILYLFDTNELILQRNKGGTRILKNNTSLAGVISPGNIKFAILSVATRKPDRSSQDRGELCKP